MAGAARGDKRYTWLLGAILLLGLALRIAAGHGALWLDEAWSAKQAHDAGTSLGVFLSINHDNNHHLNSLWLQWIGLGANPLLARAPAILTGTLAIYVASAIAVRRGTGCALATAALFAVSPMLVTLGSEARGYAPMTLAFLIAVLCTDRWLAGEAERSPATTLALCFFLGALSQLTIIFGFCALAGWVFFAQWHRGPVTAAKASLALLWPSILAIALVVAIVAGAAAASPHGFQFGRYDPFGWLAFLYALILAFASTLGWPVMSLWWLVLVPALVLLAPGAGVRRIALHRLAIVAFPLALAVLRAGNTGYPRYYLVACLALLLMLSEMIGLALARNGWRRWLAGIALATIVAGALIEDGYMIRARRGDPGGAIRAMAAREPRGTQVILDRPTGHAILQVAAAEQHYPLIIVLNPCGPARFLFLDRPDGEAFPAASRRCGRLYRPIARAQSHGLSGSHWTLYERQP
ncbi:hypothetical protein MZO42_04225 [Sphingomonas psychrotolerans]|uniref:Glycosyltransferase RgtA/B/C/D-like domain-containing protein n=1 Tax=Sphingomonas psychrotolerans TaxID=1327635 RepID=A0ABU3N3P2_9SPHN|nr:hypothetical protein [Sphingomonas psychrotolerans]MDT8757895.1 hypothetical protein [Sphingomonas psychrotolerans]